MTLAGFSSRFALRFPELMGRRLVIALSGGADSVALLHLLLDRSLGLELVAAHVHHGVRGREADDDAAFCAAMCRDLEVPFRLLRLSPPHRPSDGREAAWRRLRYQALLEAAETAQAVAVATGHQRDDVAEGVLVQLLRGAGPRALAGISAWSGQRIVRPLLPWTRREIIDWLTAHGIGWREDSSNRDPSHLRNTVRHRVLPELEQVAPAIRRQLVHLARSLAEDERVLAAELGRRSLWIDPWDPDGGVAIAALAELEPALLTRWLHAQAERSGLGRATRRQGELLRTMVSGGQPRAVSLAGRWRLYRARGQIWLEPPGTPEAYELPLGRGAPVMLPIPGWAVRIGPGKRPAWRRHPIPDDRPLVVRSPRPDDTISEAAGRRRVTSLLARRLPRHLRPVWPVVSSGDRIVCVPGVWSASVGRSGRTVTVEVIRL